MRLDSPEDVRKQVHPAALPCLLILILARCCTVSKTGINIRESGSCLALTDDNVQTLQIYNGTYNFVTGDRTSDNYYAWLWAS